MIAGLRTWRDAPGARDRVVDTRAHDGWAVDVRRAPLGVVAFVFEGRPNVFADAAGVVRTGNTAVFRIGSDALGTARAIVEHALDPALAAAGLPTGTIVLVDSAERSAGWALFGDRRLALAVARGSGPAVAQLGAVARQAGVAVSLHGTGGAWLVVGRDRRRRPPSPHARQLARPQGVQHRQRLLRPADTGGRAGSRRDRRARARRRPRRGTDGRLHVEAESVPYVDDDALHATGRRPAGRRRPRRAVRVADRRRRVGHRMGVGALAGDGAGRRRRRRRRGAALQPLQPAVHRVADQQRSRPSTTASTPPSTRRSSVTGSRGGSTGSTRSTRPSSACRTGSTAGSWHVGRSCRVTRSTPALPGVGRRPDDPPVTAGVHTASGQDHTPLMSTMRWTALLVKRHSSPSVAERHERAVGDRRCRLR